MFFNDQKAETPVENARFFPEKIKFAIQQGQLNSLFPKHSYPGNIPYSLI
jgi:hypothetical protein